MKQICRWRLLANREGEKIGFSRKQKLVEKIRWRTYLGKQGAFFGRRARNPRVSFAISKGPMFHVHAPTPRSFHSTCVRHHRCLHCRQITHGGISSFFFHPSLFPRDDIFLRFSQRDIFSSFFRLSETCFGDRFS